MRKFLLFVPVMLAFVTIFSILIVGCNYSVVMNHTEGSADHMVESDESQDGKIDPNVSVIPK